MPKEVANILVVDDKDANLMAIESTLRAPDLRIIKAPSGNEALAHLLDMEFACLLLDVKMPDMDGFELTQIIRGDDRIKDLPIIFVSGHKKGETDIFRGYEVGAVDYLVKPLDPLLLKSKVNVFAELWRKEKERQRALQELKVAKQDLEKRVSERTRELQEANLELKARADELSRSNKDLEQSAYISSHDLREPLRNVSMYVQMLRKRMSTRLEADEIDYMRFVIDGANRMQDLIRDLLLYSHSGKGKEACQKVQLDKALGEAIENLSAEIREPRAEILSDSLPVVDGRESSFLQLFQNLLSNALKFRSEHSPKIEVRVREEGDVYHFCFTDNGIGIKEDYHARIFALFQRLHSKEDYPGTGIGLAVCKKIIETHGGRIWVESRGERGSAFHFTIPKRVGTAVNAPPNQE